MLHFQLQTNSSSLVCQLANTNKQKLLWLCGTKTIWSMCLLPSCQQAQPLATERLQSGCPDLRQKAKTELVNLLAKQTGKQTNKKVEMPFPTISHQDALCCSLLSFSAQCSVLALLLPLHLPLMSAKTYRYRCIMRLSSDYFA